jgi:transposase-like protein
MTEGKSKAEVIDAKAVLAGDEAFIRTVVRAALQEVLEAEMTEAVGAAKGERTASRVGKLNSGCRRTGTAASRRSCLSDISAPSGRWWRRWRRCTCRVFRRGR